MDTRELETALKGRIGPLIHFKGIFTSDILPYIKYNSKPIIFISNTLSSTSHISIVGHWVCFYIEFFPKKRLVFFDSYGLLPSIYSQYFSEYIEKKYSKFSIYDFGKQLQPNVSQKCGLYVLLFTHYVSHYGVDRFISMFKTLFSIKYLKKNDILVTRYYFKYLSKVNSCYSWKNGKRRAITFKECKKMIGEFVSNSCNTIYIFLKNDFFLFQRKSMYIHIFFFHSIFFFLIHVFFLSITDNG